MEKPWKACGTRVTKRWTRVGKRGRRCGIEVGKGGKRVGKWEGGGGIKCGKGCGEVFGKKGGQRVAQGCQKKEQGGKGVWEKCVGRCWEGVETGVGKLCERGGKKGDRLWERGRERGGTVKE